MNRQFVILCLFSAAVLCRAEKVRQVGVRSPDVVPPSSSFVLSHVELQAGDEFQSEVLARDVRRLLATQRFSEVNAELEPSEEGGLDVYFVVSQRHMLLEPIKFEGNKHFRDSKLANWVGMEPGRLFDMNDLERAAGLIRAEYREDRFPDTKIEWVIDEINATNHATLVSALIEEGKRLKVKRTAFNGNQEVEDKALRRLAGIRPWWNPMRYFDRPVFDPIDLGQASLKVRQSYQDRGFLDADVTDARIEIDKKGRPVAVFDVEEGLQYTLAAIKVSGVRQFPLESVREQIRLTVGDAASRARIDAAVQRVQDFYGSRGYLGTRVEPMFDISGLEPGRVKVTFEVTEGQLTYVRNVRIVGNIRTRDEVIRREILVYPGEIFDAVKIKQTEQRLQNMGYFSTVQSRPGGLLDQRLPNQRDLIYSVEEKSTGSFMIGAGYSSIDRITGYVEVSQGNFDLFNFPYFTGGGQKIKLRAQVSSSRKDYQITFEEPWLFQRRLRLYTDVYWREREYSTYDIERRGLGVGLSRPLTMPRQLSWLSGRVGLRYELEKSNLEDSDVDSVWVYVDDTVKGYDFADDEGERASSSLKLSWTRDRRNHPLLPDRGYKLQAFSRIAGGPLGADTDIYQLGVNGRLYVPVWFDHTLSFEARAEVVDSFSDEKVPIDERLFLGGMRTIRGYEYRDVGPKVVPSDYQDDPLSANQFRSVGGSSMAMWSAEYTIPISRMIHFAAFYDQGNVWLDPYDFDLGETASSYGIGIRMNMPGFPIRLDYAWPLDPDDDLTEEHNWAIRIGYD